MSIADWPRPRQPSALVAVDGSDARHAIVLLNLVALGCRVAPAGRRLGSDTGRGRCADGRAGASGLNGDLSCICPCRVLHLSGKPSMRGPKFPKTIRVRGVEITAHSWSDVDEILARYGSDLNPRPPGDGSHDPQGQSGLSGPDRALLEEFVHSGARGVLVQDVRSALGASGKVGSALKAWSRRIGLATPGGTTPFLPRKRSDGRAHRLSDSFLTAARSLLAAD